MGHFDRQSVDNCRVSVDNRSGLGITAEVRQPTAPELGHSSEERRQPRSLFPRYHQFIHNAEGIRYW